MLIISSLTLASITNFLFIYITTEKKNRLARKNELTELRSLLAGTQVKVQESEDALKQKLHEISTSATNEFTQRFELLSKSVHNAQDQANKKIDSSFEQLQTENSNVQKEVNQKVSDIKSAFQQYSEKVENILSSYAQSNAEFKRNTELLKQQIQSELQNILKEIKSPLELD